VALWWIAKHKKRKLGFFDIHEKICDLEIPQRDVICGHVKEESGKVRIAETFENSSAITASSSMLFIIFFFYFCLIVFSF